MRNNHRARRNAPGLQLEGTKMTTLSATPNHDYNTLPPGWNVRWAMEYLTEASNHCVTADRNRLMDGDYGNHRDFTYDALFQASCALAAAKAKLPLSEARQTPRPQRAGASVWVAIVVGFVMGVAARALL